ncbi:MAG: GSCFA domain-containing protein [Saprospiraceae bacterium]
MIKFRTEIRVPDSSFKLSYLKSVFSIGSCFTEHIHDRLKLGYFKSYSNPCGIVYNPGSINVQMMHLIHNLEWTKDDLIEHDGLYHGLHHHGVFSNVDPEKTLNNMNTAMSLARQHIRSSAFLLLTFGSAVVYTLIEKNKIVANCHKIPSNRFEKRLLDVEEIVEATKAWITSLMAINQKIKIILTISPIRYLKDGFDGNSRNKARLILAAEQLCASFPQLYYFPAYEIVMDDLRDYRFYKEDMVHPNDLAINYIWDIFKSTFMDKETLDLNGKLSSIRQGLAHRPLHPDSPGHLRFKKQLEKSIEEIRFQNPFIEF